MEKKDENKVVKFNSDLNKNLFLAKLSSKEIDLFYAICIKIREKGDSITKITFSEIKSLSHYTHKSKERFLSDIENVCKKILLANWSGRLPDNSRVGATIFSAYKIDAISNEISIKLNEDFLYLFNNLYNNITIFNIEETCSLVSKYSKIQYKNFKEEDIKGECVEDYSEFKEKMNASKMSAINITRRILKPIEDELSKKFDNFQIIKEKKGREISKLKWRWKEKDDDPYKFFCNLFSNIKVNFTYKIQSKIAELQKEKSNEEIENIINEAWELIKSNQKVKNPPALLSKAITDIGLETFINNSKEMKHKIECNKESAQREKKWAKEKEKFKETSVEIEKICDQVLKSTKTTKIINNINEKPVKNENRNDNFFFSEFEGLLQKEKEELFLEAKEMYTKEKEIDLFGDINNQITIATLMPYIKELIKNKK